MITIIAFLSLITLLAIHEFGHFFVAKKFGVRVEEFGIGYPPRLFKKEYRGTIYSLNLLPFGAFVRFPDENGKDDQVKYSHQPVGKRFWIAMAGVISFWILAIVLLTLVLTIGTRVNIEDNDITNLINPRVTIIGVQPKSPAAISGMMPGDNIISMAVSGNPLKIEKVKDVQGFVSENLKSEIRLVLERGDETLEVSLKPRENPQNGEGAMGIILSKTTIKKVPFYRAPIEAILNTGRLTMAIINGYYNAIINLFRGVPTGVEPMGPIGIIGLASQAGKLGVSYFIQFIAMICLYLAVFNLLPIPVTDGGRVVFLLIEKIRGRAINQKIEEKIEGAFFVVLLILMEFVTIKDVVKLF